MNPLHDVSMVGQDVYSKLYFTLPVKHCYVGGIPLDLQAFSTGLL